MIFFYQPAKFIKSQLFISVMNTNTRNTLYIKNSALDSYKNFIGTGEMVKVLATEA